MNTNCYAAVDIGASSGRVVVGTLTDNQRIELTEIHRFDNIQVRSNGHDCWNIDMLLDEVINGLAKCKEEGFQPKTVGIDTWGVDFVLLDANDNLIGDAVAYRDSRTVGMYAIADEIMSPEAVYRLTGIQRQPFNTLYQLLALQREHPEQLKEAQAFLMIPDYLAFKLTGCKVNEYTNATTTSLLNARTQKWESSILEAFDIPQEMFCEIVMPGTSLGPLKPEIAERIGYNTTLIAPATHDTGSAYLAVPARDQNAVFLSSGTWSLLGVEHEGPITSDASRFQNFTNEGGFELRFRFLKNIMGLWMIQSVRRELNGVSYVEGKTKEACEALSAGVSDASSASVGEKPAGTTKTSIASGATKTSPQLPPFAFEKKQWGFGDLISAAKEAQNFEAQVNVNDDRFLAPDSMIKEIRLACFETGQAVPSTVGELLRCIYLSLSHCYAESIQEMSALTGREYTSINIVGGGCQDEYLNTLTAKACGIPVFAGPVEGTSLGNLAVQMLHSGDFPDVQSVREAIAKSFDVVSYE